MKRRTVNMFAATNEDLPLFSGATVDVEVAEFNPGEVVEEVKPMPMFAEQPATLAEMAAAQGLSNYTVEALAICETSGLDGAKRIQLWIYDHNVMACYRQVTAYQQALIIYARSIGIEVNDTGNITYNGWYDLYEAMWQRMSAAEQDVYRHTHKDN